MNKLSLNRSELQELIGRYYSEVRKLSYQLQKTQKTIQELEGELQEKPVVEIPNIETTGSSSTETASSTSTSSRRGRPPKKTNGEETGKMKIVSKKPRRKGYKLSETDEFVIHQLESHGKPLISAELIDLAEADSNSKGEKFDLEDFKIKLNRSIHKLANRRGDLLKLKYEGRGFSYALPEWVNKEGVLKKKFER